MALASCVVVNVAFSLLSLSNVLPDPLAIYCFRTAAERVVGQCLYDNPTPLREKLHTGISIEVV